MKALVLIHNFNNVKNTIESGLPTLSTHVAGLFFSLETDTTFLCCLWHID